MVLLLGLQRACLLWLYCCWFLETFGWCGVTLLRVSRLVTCVGFGFGCFVCVSFASVVLVYGGGGFLGNSFWWVGCSIV